MCFAAREGGEWVKCFLDESRHENEEKAKLRGSLQGARNVANVANVNHAATEGQKEDTKRPIA